MKTMLKYASTHIIYTKYYIDKNSSFSSSREALYKFNSGIYGSIRFSI